MHRFDDNNTSITFDNTYFLKIYRKVDYTTNPDVEVTRYLSERMHFEYVPAFYGTIDWALERGTVVLGMMQKLIENHGDGRTYMLERIANFIERIKARDLATLHPDEQMGDLQNPLLLKNYRKSCRCYWAAVRQNKCTC